MCLFRRYFPRKIWPQPASMQVWGSSPRCTVLVCISKLCLKPNFAPQPGSSQWWGFSFRCTSLLWRFKQNILPNFLPQPSSSQWKGLMWTALMCLLKWHFFSKVLLQPVSLQMWGFFLWCTVDRFTKGLLSSFDWRRSFLMEAYIALDIPPKKFAQISLLPWVPWRVVFFYGR